MAINSNIHHLVLGELEDFLTGKTVADTLDERYHQKIAKLLVLNKGFNKENICSNHKITVNAGDKKAVLKIDFLISYNGKNVVLIKYAPGSLVTRRISTIALSRIVESYQIPFAVITNGEDAEIIEGKTGCIVSHGLDQIPDLKKIEKIFNDHAFLTIGSKEFDQASRIAYAFEVDGACPCDSDVCIIKD